MPRKSAAQKPKPSAPVDSQPTEQVVSVPQVESKPVPLVSFYRLKKFSAQLFEIQEIQVPENYPVKTTSKKDAAQFLVDRLGQMAYDDSKKSRA